MAFRAPNFTENEISFVLKCLEAEPELNRKFEGKALTKKQQNKKWNIIANKYNALFRPEENKTGHQLRTKWNDLKYRVRRKFSNLEEGSDDESSPHKKPNRIERRVLSLLDPKFAVEPTECDSATQPVEIRTFSYTPHSTTQEPIRQGPIVLILDSVSVGSTGETQTFPASGALVKDYNGIRTHSKGETSALSNDSPTAKDLEGNLLSRNEAPTISTFTFKDLEGNYLLTNNEMSPLPTVVSTSSIKEEVMDISKASDREDTGCENSFEQSKDCELVDTIEKNVPSDEIETIPPDGSPKRETSTARVRRYRMFKRRSLEDKLDSIEKNTIASQDIATELKTMNQHLSSIATSNLDIAKFLRSIDQKQDKVLTLLSAALNTDDL